MLKSYDVVIIGGGPAGLSAALLLGRCRRSVLVCSDNRHRNAPSRAIHGLLGHEGENPLDYVANGRLEVAKYPTVKFSDATVLKVTKVGEGFAFTGGEGTSGYARKVLFATGLTDILPKIAGIKSYYGISVHHCLYCDGYEYADQPISAYGQPDRAIELAAMMMQWSCDVVVCTDGTGQPTLENTEKARRLGISIIESSIVSLEGTEGRLQFLCFEDGSRLRRTALFFSIGCRQTSDLADQLGCLRDEKGGIIVDAASEETSIRGAYVAGDASRDVLLVAVAVAEGAKAAVAINRALLRESGLL